MTGLGAKFDFSALERAAGVVERVPATHPVQTKHMAKRALKIKLFMTASLLMRVERLSMNGIPFISTACGVLANE
jgi:hypothetical protein